MDIEGHRNSLGGFDHDMLEIQKEFILGFLGEYLTSICIPLGKFDRKIPQNNDLPDILTIDTKNR